jgi:hypothetical protein
MIPDNVSPVGIGPFDHCENLSSITIPESITYVGSNAFYFWTEGQTINIKGKADRKATIDAGWYLGWDYQCDAEIVYQDLPVS